MSTSSWMDGSRFCASSFLRWRSFLFVVGTTLVLTLGLMSALRADPIHSRLNPAGSIMAYKVSPDGNLVASAGRYSDINNLDLYVVPIQGGPQVKVGTTPYSDQIGEQFFFTPDGSRIVYWVKTDTNAARSIYSSSTVDGSSVELSNDLASNEYSRFESRDFRENRSPISPDGQWVVYSVVSTSGFGAYKLVSAPTAGGTPKTLATRGFAGYFSTYRISPNSQYVVLVGDLNGTNREELYSAPIGGGTLTRLSPTLAEMEYVQKYYISPDSSRVIYLVARTDHSEIYSVPIAGGDPTPITGFDGSPNHIGEFIVDGSKFLLNTVATGAAENTLRYRIYLAPVTGGDATLVNTIEDSPGNYAYESSLWLLSGEQEVIFVADNVLSPNLPNRVIYRVPLNGSGASILYGPGNVPLPMMSEDRNDLVFVNLGGFFAPSTIVSFDIRTSNVITLDQLNMPPTASGSSTIYFSPDGNGLVYAGRHDQSGRDQLFAVSFTGTPTGTISVANGESLSMPLEAPVLHNNQVCAVYTTFQTTANLYSSCYTLPLIADQKVYLPLVEAQ